MTKWIGVLNRATPSASNTLLASEHAGSPGGWMAIARQGAPRVALPGNGQWQVTFLWRDPQGGEATSGYQRVWILINCLTDHHQPNPAQSLQRLPGTDVWFWQTGLPGAWRSSDCVIPCLDNVPYCPTPRAICLILTVRGRAPAAIRFPGCRCRINCYRSYSMARGTRWKNRVRLMSRRCPAWCSAITQRNTACGLMPTLSQTDGQWRSARQCNAMNGWRSTGRIFGHYRLATH